MRNFLVVLSVFLFPVSVMAQNLDGLNAEEFSNLSASDGFKALQSPNKLAATPDNLNPWIEKAKQAKTSLTVATSVDQKIHHSVVLQVGHLGRTKGSTGSTGKYITEQEGASLIVQMLSDELADRNVEHIVLDADSYEFKDGKKLPKGILFKTDLFLSFHLDGSNKPCASSASLGYNPKFGKLSMQLLGAALAIALDINAENFMRDNFTKNLSHYQDYGRSNSQIAEGIVELSELSCATQEERFLLNSETIAKNFAIAITFMLKEAK